MTLTYEWDEVRIRERMEAAGLILAFDLNDRNHFRVLDHDARKVAIVVGTPHGFQAITSADFKYHVITNPTSEQKFFTALAEIIGANA